MDGPPKIIDLSKIVEPHLNGGKFISYTSRNLTKPGDNYGSIMLAVSAKIQQPNGAIEDLPLVAKLPPLTNETFWKIFKPEITALRENAIYTDLSPSVRQLQLDRGVPEDELIDVFAKSYGCRISLNDNATVLDRDAVLVLENLQTSGYRAGERQVMFDYDHTKLVLKYVAKFHALPIALRQLEPEKFNKDIRTKFMPFNMFNGVEPEQDKEFKEQMVNEIRAAVGDDSKVIKRWIELEEEFSKYMRDFTHREVGLFTSIAHCDLWINNVMILYDASNTPSKLKIVDFQISQYDSIAHDVIFLFLSSVDTDVLEEHYEDLLKYYYNEFIECLQKLKCDISEYSYEKLMEEIKRIAHIQIPHATFMVRAILADEKTLPDDFKDYDFETFSRPPSSALIKRLGDILRLSQKLGFFW